jgi:amino acid transporter
MGAEKENENKVGVSVTTSPYDLNLERQKWATRRRMAWAAFHVTIVIILGVFFLAIFGTKETLERVLMIKDFLSSCIFLLVGLVCTFMGLATYSEIKQSQQDVGSKK